MTSRLGAAIRFALTLAVVDFTSLALLGNNVATTSASFAVVASLYFLDFDGRARERLGAYSISLVISVAGIFVGFLVHESLLATLVAAFVIGFVFAIARAFRGFIARSFVGAQLAFVLAVFTDNAPENLRELLSGWLLGSALSLIAALLVFPRYHSGLLRRALSDWCIRVATYIRAPESNRDSAQSDVLHAVDRIDDIDRGEQVAGLWSKRQRALAALSLHVHQTTEFMAEVPAIGKASSEHASLVGATADAFERASRMVLLDGRPEPFLPFADLRRREFENELARSRISATDLEGTGESDRFDAWVLSMSAESVQALAAASHGWKHPNWPLALEPEHSVWSLIRRTFRWDSIWLFHGLRTGGAVAAAIAIALAMGLEHGVWVVMTTLALINVSFTTSASSRNALEATIGVLGGILVSALIIITTHQWWVLAVLVPLLAFVAKWCLPSSAILSQLTYTPFAVANVALLGWPSPQGLNVVRFEDIAVGAAVAVVATIVTFPFGMRRLLDRVWLRAHASADEALAATKHALESATEVPHRLVRDQQLSFARATDAIDTAYAGAVRLGPRMGELTARSRWLNLAMLCQIGLEKLVERRRELGSADPGDALLNLWASEALAVVDRARPSPTNRVSASIR